MRNNSKINAGREREYINKGENRDVELRTEVLRDQVRAGTLALRQSEEVIGGRLSDSLWAPRLHIGPGT